MCATSTKFPITLRLDDADRDLQQLRTVPVGIGDGHAVTLSDLAEFRMASGAINISRENAQRRGGRHAQARGRQRAAAGGLPAGVVRRVREPAARDEAAGLGDSAVGAADLRAAVRCLQGHQQCGADPGQRATGDDRRHPGAVADRHSVVGVGGDRLHCIVRASRVERGGDAQSLRPAARTGHGPAAVGGAGFAAAPAHGADDRAAGDVRPAADGDLARDRCRDPEAFGGGGDRRPAVGDAADPAGAAHAVLLGAPPPRGAMPTLVGMRQGGHPAGDEQRAVIW
ncbi:hypothetical protein G6F35_012434 [Rhizopus arrhizus]|nr:hypothetical protein G6F35_012434 [Rhizopus arrhizus]